MIQGVCEIDLGGDLALPGPYPCRGDEYPVLQVGTVLHRIEDAWTRRARVLLLSVSCAGGEGLAGVLLYAAIRSFADAGGRVVAFVGRGAMSAGLTVMLAADYIVASPRAEFAIHGAAVEMVGCDGIPAGVARAAADRLRDTINWTGWTVLAAHSLVPALTVAGWMVRSSFDGYDDPAAERFLTERALALGLVDEAGDLDRARRICEELAGGSALPRSPRRAALEARGAPEGVPPEALTAVRRVGVGLGLELALLEAK